MTPTTGPRQVHIHLDKAVIIRALWALLNEGYAGTQSQVHSISPRTHTQYCCSVTQSCLTLWNPLTVARQAPLSLTMSQSLLKFMSIEPVMLSNYLVLCCSLLLLFPSIRVFSSELAFCIRCQSIEVSASASILSMNIQG